MNGLESPRLCGLQQEVVDRVTPKCGLRGFVGPVGTSRVVNRDTTPSAFTGPDGDVDQRRSTAALSAADLRLTTGMPQLSAADQSDQDGPHFVSGRT